MTDKAGPVIIFLIWFLTILPFLFITECVAHTSVKEQWHKESVERGFAQYNINTGEWEWKERDINETD